MKILTSERLAKVLDHEGLLDLATKARNGWYDDFRSPLATPIAQLVCDLLSVARNDLAARAIGWEWDSTKEEAEEWYRWARWGKSI